MELRLDHLVVAAADLAAGAAHVERSLGLRPIAGGRHETMGTHNVLVGLADGVYLEVIAIDPAGVSPAQPRWFGLDIPEVRRRIAAGPFLLTWVARVEGGPAAIDRLHRELPDLVGEPRPFARGEYRWRLAVPPALGADTRRHGGAFPTVIQWDVPFHPSERLPASGGRLERFRASHPDPAVVRRDLERAGLAPLIELTTGPDVRLSATIETPNGTREIE